MFLFFDTSPSGLKAWFLNARGQLSIIGCANEKTHEMKQRPPYLHRPMTAGLPFDDQTALHLPPSTSQVYKTERRLSPGRLERSLHRRDLSLHTMSGCPLQHHVLLSFWQQFFPPGPFPLDPSMDPLSSMTQMTQFLLCSKSFCWVLPYRCVKVKGERTFDVEKKRNARLPERHNSLSARSRRERHCCSFEAWTCNWQCSALCAHIAAQMPAEPGAKPGKCE